MFKSMFVFDKLKQIFWEKQTDAHIHIFFMCIKLKLIQHQI